MRGGVQGRPYDRLLGHADLAVAAVDGAGADVVPAVAMMRRVAGGADDRVAGVDRLAADLTDGRAGVLVGRPGAVDDRDPLVHPAVDALEQAVVDDQGLA